ncbi:phosphotransferase enzyme family protein [Rutstroemia sp. NJR-2017a BVV2]|nr:phosphotransferase enzyme family protein [Rutstroemia sp. NJR-2017a BVV2]
MQIGARRLVRVGPYMIKYGTGVSPIEGENMLFVKRETMVPVPLVYAIYSIKKMSRNTTIEEDCTYIVMEYLEDGPFDTERELNEAMCRKSIYNNSRMAEKAEFYGRAFPAVLKGHAPVFTHGDFQRKNIIIRNRAPTEVQRLEARG